MLNALDLPILQRQRLPKQTTPPKGQKHIPRPGIQIVKRQVRRLRDRDENRVDSCARDTHHERVDTHARH